MWDESERKEVGPGLDSTSPQERMEEPRPRDGCGGLVDDVEGQLDKG